MRRIAGPAGIVIAVLVGTISACTSTAKAVRQGVLIEAAIGTWRCLPPGTPSEGDLYPVVVAVRGDGTWTATVPAETASSTASFGGTWRLDSSGITVAITGTPAQPPDVKIAASGLDGPNALDTTMFDMSQAAGSGADGGHLAAMHQRVHVSHNGLSQATFAPEPDADNPAPQPITCTKH